MRHRHGFRKLGMTGDHRRAMFRNIACALIEREQIKTTLARAKELRRVVEPLITLGKKPTVANRRLAFARLGSRGAVVKLFDDLGVRAATRPGGYVRVLRAEPRKGDNAPMAIVELVDKAPPPTTETAAAKTEIEESGSESESEKTEESEEPEAAKSPASPTAA